MWDTVRPRWETGIAIPKVGWWVATKTVNRRLLFGCVEGRKEEKGLDVEGSLCNKDRKPERSTGDVEEGQQKM